MQWWPKGKVEPEMVLPLALITEEKNPNTPPTCVKNYILLQQEGFLDKLFSFSYGN